MIRVSLMYTAILALIFIVLSLRVVKNRFKSKVSLGDGGNTLLNIAIRTHSNFAEYVPIALMLLVSVEFLAYPVILVHILGSLLILARLSHVYGLANKNSLSIFRPVGVISTVTVIVVSSILVLVRSV